MRVDEFYQSRKDDWESLSNLLELSQGNMRGLSESQVRDLSRLYRAATSDLALAKRDFPRSEITTYLNQLVARAHAVVYHACGGLQQQATRVFSASLGSSHSWPRCYF
jgi:hypothetical protein